MSIAENEAILDHADRDKGLSDGPPVFLFGNTLDDGEIWQMLAELSFTVVVGEDFCYGQKQAETLVEETDGDPFLRIARAQLNWNVVGKKSPTASRSAKYGEQFSCPPSIAIIISTIYPSWLPA
jgi:hypothetical protein